MARNPALDAGRAILLLLGLPYHVAGMALFEMVPRPPDFADSPLIVVFVSAAHAFRMFAFFLISGYFSAMIVERRGKRYWIADRLTRLGLPLATGLLTVGVAEYWLNVHLLGQPAEPLAGLPVTIGHMWFLGVLIAYCVLFLAVPASALRKSSRAISGASARRLSIAAVLILLALWGFVDAELRQARLLAAWHSDALNFLLNFVQFLPAFALGVLAWTTGLRDRLFGMAGWKLTIVTAVLMMAYVLLDTLARPSLGLPIAKDLGEKIVSNAITLPLALLASLVFFAWLGRAIVRPHKAVDFLVEGAVAIYLLHYPIAQVLTWAFSTLPVPVELRWAGASFGVLGLSILVFAAIRTSHVAGILVCGKRAGLTGLPVAQPALGPFRTAAGTRLAPERPQH